MSFQRRRLSSHNFLLIHLSIHSLIHRNIWCNEINFSDVIQSIKIYKFSKITATVEFNLKKCNSARLFRQTKGIRWNPWSLNVLLEIVSDFGRHGDLVSRSLYVSIIPWNYMCTHGRARARARVCVCVFVLRKRQCLHDAYIPAEGAGWYELNRAPPKCASFVAYRPVKFGGCFFATPELAFTPRLTMICRLPGVITLVKSCPNVGAILMQLVDFEREREREIRN